MIQRCLLLLLALAMPVQAAERPNILWITCEDASPTLGCYGDVYAVTPHLDRFATQGVRYTHAFTVAGVCAPSRSCLISGMYPTALGSHHMRSRAALPASIRILPALLRSAGYYCSNSVKTDYNFPPPPDAWDESNRKAHWRNRRPGQPFFSVFNHNGTHESFIRADFDRTEHDPARANLPPFLPDTPIVRRDWARYHDLVTAMDREVGRLLKQLEDDGLADSTIVFFFSDHGVGLPRAKQWIWDAGLHVPLIIRVPKKYQRLAPSAPGTSCDQLVSFVDFAPTVLSLAGVPVPQTMQGQAFLGPRAGPPRQYIHASRDRMDERYDVQRAVRDRRWKYFRNYMPYLPYAPWLDYMELLPTMREWRRLHAAGALVGPPAQFMRPSKPAEELYDLAADPHELNNLADSPEHREVLQRMRAVHQRWARDTKDLGLLPEQDMLDRGGGRPEYELAQDPQRFPLDTILEAAELVGQPDVLPRLRRGLAHPDSAVRFWAVQGLINLGSAARPAANELMPRLADPSAEVRIAAAHALCNLDRDADALPVLVKALNDRSNWVRLAAANVLDRIGAKAKPAMNLMKKAAQADTQENRFVRWVLLHALKKLEPEQEFQECPP